MSKLKSIRELKNLTQEELSDKSGISARTIQRIESGRDPKGYTLRVLAKVLEVQESELVTQQTKAENIIVEENEPLKEGISINYSYLKLINLSTIPFTVIPLLNILVPLILMLVLKQKNALTKQLISVQILWTIVAPILFMLGIFLKLGNKFTLLLIILIVFSNVFIILRNAIEIDRNKTLYYKLDFNLI
ncbi:protein of unknown function [Flavobacterium fryxellicola]|uniref:DNA-binding protein n=1 Tax=Flavobacterium fryxellicola TaxID=249352 RepID=A0A162KXA2_9FLAO|nr:helix-turn-helix domain-containing protein [Flavobacterium fryxellicola]OAB26024.1 DNA-binding protein [Flavobacterium fryxellicola]SHN80215.1 protein of unknown function [Flavobacterium fryxellicola]